jgi:hypothetical protein
MAQSSEHVNAILSPDDSFWQRYSPHHEAPVAAAIALTLYGLALGVMLLIAWTTLLARTSEASRPPNMDVVYAMGEPDGGGGGEPAPLGQPDGEQEAPAPKIEANPAKTEEKFPAVPSIPVTDVPETVLDKTPDPATDSVGEDLERIDKEVKKTAKPAPKAVAQNPPKGGKRKGPRGLPDGVAGGKGPGGFGGGPPGKGGPRGIALTKQQVYAQRWRFDMSGNGKEHAAKLAAAGVILIVHDRFGGYGVLRDLRKRPAVPMPENLFALRNAVQWTNNKQDSLFGLATELQLNAVPVAVTILLPKEREEKMAEAEAAYAQQHGLDFKQITETWFDFRLHNGTFEPVVIRQK